MKVKLNVPEMLSEVTLGQYIDFLELGITEETRSSEALQKVIEIFCKVDFKDVAQMKYSDLSKIGAHINGIFEEKCALIPRVKLKGEQYGFIPELDNITLGEYVDLDNYFNDWTTIDRAMCVLYRPITLTKEGKYLIEDYKGTDHFMDMRSMPMNVVMGARVFFYSLGNELLSHIPNYLMTANLTDQQRIILEQSGDGIQAFIDLQRDKYGGSTM